ncbi:type IV pilus secretin PilQ family protein [Psychrobium sp. MM17-31]|uniref:type IV pilus secretin PilQ n=1 Tax=Psychrobium sp. MM17-31 TaxID=2917758 RepID=UPI001EF72FF6|nr:type IV pilus secretin PilQ family protein [Psychrobium sp. MM17-31]
MNINQMFRRGLFLLMAMPSLAFAKDLVDVQYSELPTKQIKIDFIFDEQMSSKNVQLVAQDKQIFLDFGSVDNKLELDLVPDNALGVNGIKAMFESGRLQVMLSLTAPVTHQVNAQDKTYSILLDKSVAMPVAAINTPKVTPVKDNPTPIVSSFNAVDSLDFKLDQKERGELIVRLKDQSVTSMVTQNGSRIEIKLKGATIGEDNLYTMDVLDFATPVRSFETFREEDGVLVVVQTHKEFEYEHKQIGNDFVLTVFEPVKETFVEKEQKKVVYTGKKFSLNFQKVAVRTALQIIADFNNFNLVTGDSVTGDITLRLEDVPWDQALDMILKFKGLGKRIEGNILLVAPAEELATREATELKSNQEVEKLVPLYTEFLQINYAKAKEIATLLDSGSSKILSGRGSVAVDERTNTLLIQDTAKKLDDIRRLVEILDVAVKQVVIEARIVTVTDNINEEFGIKWGVTDTLSDGATSGSLVGANTASGGIVPALDDRLNVNLPIADSAGTIAFQVSKLADGTILDLELSALERENKGEIIARPSITTANQSPAFIEQGTEIPYVSAASSGATTVTFKPAVLSLKVTPHITPDNRVILDLNITQDTRGDTVKTAIGEAVAINTQRIGTQVLVSNGETIVLGGIYQQQLIYGVSKVPVLGDIPLLGWMFRTSKDFTERRELLIFVTPRIVTEAQER